MDFIKGVPKLNPDLSYNNLNLTPVEGYLLSRIDGVSSVEDIASTSGLPYEQAIEIVKSLWNKKVFSIDGIESQPVGSEKKDDIDLTTQERANIEKMLEIVKNGNYYQMLSVPLDVKPAEVKVRFFELSKLYHPDKYFKKNIGVYKDKLNTIFKKLSEAYEALYDPKKKRWYDANLANSRLHTKSTVQTSSLKQTDTASNTEETVKIEKPDFKATKQTSSNNTEKTIKLETYDTQNLTVEQKIERIKERLNNNMLELALKEIDALQDIKDTRIPLLLADYYLKQNNLLVAKDYVQRAIEYDNRNIEAYRMLGNIYTTFKLYRNALKVYEIIKGLQPDNADVNVMIDKIKSLIED